ncbi:MAG: 3-dehydroquinate synthase [Micrococcales bacterium]
MSDITRIKVSGDDTYDVLIGRGMLDEVRPQIPAGVKKVLLIHPLALQVSADSLADELRGGGLEVFQAGVSDGEDAKRIEVAAWCWGIMGKSDFTRSDAIVGFGGGSTTDLAGFVAATWLRGVAYVAIPTTLLGMVDAAVGGKTGINTAEGKNLVGAFYAPKAVICDLDTLVTLPRIELISGFGEVAKYGFISDERILQLLELDLEKATDPTSKEFREIVERCIAVKAKVVSADFKESGEREVLNYGHTLGHAIELVERFQWRHGAAISVGMMFVAQLGLLLGHTPVELVDRQERILSSLGLPTTYRGGRFQQLHEAMRRDKKSRAGALRFIALEGVGRPRVITSPNEESLVAAYGEITTPNR